MACLKVPSTAQIPCHAWTSQALIEKGNDFRASAAIGSADIARFYDSLPLLSISKYLVLQGLPGALINACLATQMCPCVSVNLMNVSFDVLNRSIGGLTGSRVAGMFGLAVGLDMATTCAPAWDVFGYRNYHFEQ